MSATAPLAPFQIDAQGIATLTIRGAKALNIIGSPAIAAATQALARLREAPGLRVLVQFPMSATIFQQEPHDALPSQDAR